MVTSNIRLTADERRHTTLLTPQEIARQYGLPLRIQAELRASGRFAPIIRFDGSRRVYVKRVLFEQWLDAHTQVDGAEGAGAELAAGMAETEPALPSNPGPAQLVKAAQGP